MTDVKRMALILLLLTALFGVACNNEETQDGTTARRKPAGKSKPMVVTALAADSHAGGTTFTKLEPADSGIDFKNMADSRELRLSTLSFYAGLASQDFDRDGDLDVFMCGIESDNKLFRNDGNFKFTDVTAEAGDGLSGGNLWASGAGFADFNADGHYDLYVCNLKGPNQLFMGDGTGKFVNEAEARGLASESASICPAMFDVEGDGDLDLYVANYNLERNSQYLKQASERQAELKFDPQTNVTTAPADLAGQIFLTGDQKLKQTGQPDQLFINDGQGNFVEKTKEAGIWGYGWTLTALASDFDDNGRVDLFTTGDYESPDHYWLNNGDGTFRDGAREMLRRTGMFSMGADAGDINEDGLIDVFVGDMMPTSYKDGRKQSGDMLFFQHTLLHSDPQQNMRNMMYVNRGDGWMTEMAELVGAHASDWSWACRIVDLDCDGNVDLFNTNGYLSTGIEIDNAKKIEALRLAGRHPEADEFSLSLPPLANDNKIFMGDGNYKFSAPEGNLGMADKAVDCGASTADYDGDGDIDIITNTTNGQAGVYRNDFAAGNRIVVQLVGDAPNEQAFGARVWANVGESRMTQDVILTRGFATGESGRVHFGLGDAAQVDKLEIRWPDGSLQTEENLAAGNMYTIYKAAKLPKWEKPAVEALFAANKVDWKQTEQYTYQTEVDKEILIPVFQSTLGTGVGTADVNGDGHLDVYFAGASGQAGKLFTGDGKGGLTASDLLSDAMPTAAEQMSVLWFDANADGKTDLLLTSGSMESPENSDVYQPRLLLSDGAGAFTPATLPARKISTGSAAAADFDGDGDLDLALCGNVRPYKYSLSLPNALWINDGKGTFTDGTDTLAKGFGKRPEQVQEVQFADVTGDGKTDMLLAVKWGAVEVWPGNGTGFDAAKKISDSGWWQGLGVGDFDNDGDLDIIAGNTGANVKYHPSKEKPVTLFAADFDDNGIRDVVEVKYAKDGSMLPGRGRSCSGYAINYIPKKFPTWSEFADASFEDVYGAKLDEAERYDAVDLHSMLLTNDGSGAFTATNLPGSANWAPVWGVAVGDFNLDGNLDAFLTNNFYGTQPETGRWNPGYGVVMIGDGKGGFKDLGPQESGLSLWWDTRGVVPADFNGDGALDLVISASNDSPTIALAMPEQTAGGKGLAVTLTGKAPNTLGVGAKLALTLDNGTVLTRTVQAGSGYLSSYNGPQHFGIPAGASATSLKVTWADGSTSDATDLSAATITVAQ
jgi:hypothetical protein